MTAHGGGIGPSGYVRHIEAMAHGGVGMTIVSGASFGVDSYTTAVAPFNPSEVGAFGAVLPNPATAEGAAFYDERVIPHLTNLAEVAHRNGALCISQIHHLAGNPDWDDYQPAVGPSAFHSAADHYIPHELDADEIQVIVAAFAHAARRAKTAGMDGVELHGAHGYLINKFLSPYTNRRTDRYGGTLEKRLRFLLEILDAVQETNGADFPIGLRISSDELPGGLTIADMEDIGRRVRDRIMYVNVSETNIPGLNLIYPAPWLLPFGYNLPLAAAVKQAVGLPVIVTGGIRDPHDAERILSDGSADLIGMVRALLADPELPEKARTGRLDEVRWCIAAGECHQWHGTRGSVVCAVNPDVSRREEMQIIPAETAKTVLVVGAGPAGMETARVAALRGHRVYLCDRERVLGGAVRAIAADPSHHVFADMMVYYDGALSRAGVELVLGDEVTVDVVREMAPDAVVVATGASPFIPDVPGVNNPNVVTAIQVLTGQAKVGDHVLVVAELEEFYAPLIVAEFLANQGKAIEVVSGLLTVGLAVEPRTLHMIVKRLLEKGVTLTPHTTLAELADHTVTVMDRFTESRRVLEGIDNVVLACGSRSDGRLYEQLKGKVGELYSVGDCRSPRRIVHAVLEGARVARLL